MLIRFSKPRRLLQALSHSLNSALIPKYLRPLPLFAVNNFISQTHTGFVVSRQRKGKRNVYYQLGIQSVLRVVIWRLKAFTNQRQTKFPTMLYFTFSMSLLVRLASSVDRQAEKKDLKLARHSGHAGCCLLVERNKETSTHASTMMMHK